MSKLAELAAKLKKAQAQIKKNEATINSLRGQIKTRDPLENLDLDTDRGVMTDAIMNKIHRVNQLTDAVKNLSQSGLNFRDRNDLKEGLAETIESIDLLLGKASLGRKSFEELAKGLKSFAEFSKIADASGRSLVGTLGMHQAALRRAGLASQDFQKVVDITTFSLKGNASEVENINLRLAKFARDSGIHTSTISRNFQLLSKNLMLDSGNIEKELVRTQRVEQQTGVSVQRQYAALAGVTTDFSSASTMAGNLNALLGGNKLSATELFMSLGPGEVQQKIKEALKGTRMEKDITSTDGGRIAQKRRQLAIHTMAKTTGFTPDEIRRMYDMGDADAVQRDIRASAAVTFDTDPKGNLGKFETGLGNATGGIRKFTEILLQSQTSIRTMFDLYARRLELEKPGKTLLGQQAFMLKKEFGALTAPGFNFADLVKHMPTDKIQSLGQLAQMKRIGVISTPIAEKIFKGVIDKDPTKAANAWAQLDEKLQQAWSFPGAPTDPKMRLGYVQRAYRVAFGKPGLFGLAEAIRSGNWADAKAIVEKEASAGNLTDEQKKSQLAEIEKAKKAMKNAGKGKKKGAGPIQDTPVEPAKGTNIPSHRGTPGPSASTNSFLNAGSGQYALTLNIPLFLDGKEVARASAPHILGDGLKLDPSFG